MYVIKSWIFHKHINIFTNTNSMLIKIHRNFEQKLNNNLTPCKYFFRIFSIIDDRKYYLIIKCIIIPLIVLSTKSSLWSNVDQRGFFYPRSSRTTNQEFQHLKYDDKAILRCIKFKCAVMDHSQCQKFKRKYHSSWIII